MSKDGRARRKVVLSREQRVDGEILPDPDGIDGREGVENGTWSLCDVAPGEGEDFR